MIQFRQFRNCLKSAIKRILSFVYKSFVSLLKNHKNHVDFSLCYAYTIRSSKNTKRI